MAQERIVTSNREEEITALGGLDCRTNRNVRDTAYYIRKFLEEQSSRMGFSFVVNGEPFCEVNPVLGGRAGINIIFAYLEEHEKKGGKGGVGSEICYHELPVRLRYAKDALKEGIEWADFLKALNEPEDTVEIECSFEALPQEGVSVITEDKAGRIVINGIKITKLSYLDEGWRDNR